MGFLVIFLGCAASNVIINVGFRAQGKGEEGNINIQARSLSLINNATLNSSTFGQGDAGSISVQVSDSVSLANSFINSAVGQRGVGSGGDINIQTRSPNPSNK